MRLNKSCFIILIGIVNLTAAYVYAEKPMKEHWKEVGLSFSDIRKRGFPNILCLSGENHFVGCVQAINALFVYLEKPIAFVTQELSDGSKNYGAIVQDFGKTKIVIRNEPKIPNPKVAFKILKEEQVALIQSWKRFFKAMKEADLIVASQAPTIPTPSEPKKYFDFTPVFEWIREQFIKPDTDSEYTAAMINGYLQAAFDPHSYVVPQSVFKEQLHTTHPPFAGIGTTLGVLKEKIIFVNILENEPADVSGLKEGDILMAVNDEPIVPSMAKDVASKIKGPVGTFVKITVQRGLETLTFNIPRKVIVIPHLKYKKYNYEKFSLGYIRMEKFVEDENTSSCKMMEAALKTLTADGIDGLILDLRNNGGGLLNEAVCSAGFFLNEGSPIVTQRELDGKTIRNSLAVTGKFSFKFLKPLVVLVNTSSASASEMVSGALQDYSRSVTVGERTFGKGTVQNIERWWISPSKVLLAITKARFHLPSGRTNQVVGIEPDLPVFMKPNPSEDDLFAMREEDLFANPLPPIGDKWVQPRPLYIHDLKTCVEHKDLARKIYIEREQAGLFPSDYQRDYAKDTLYCMLSK